MDKRRKRINTPLTLNRVKFEAMNCLSTCLTNAALLDDWTLYKALYESYEAVCLYFARDASDDSSFYYETLGDFASDNKTRIHYYLRALRRARKHNTPKHSILIELAECYANEGRRKPAIAAFEEAIEDTGASRRKDDRDIRTSAITGLKKFQA